MPDPVQISAFDKLLDYGVLGIAIVFLIGAVMWLTKKLFQTQDHVLAAKEAHKEDAIRFAAMTEVLKNQMQNQAELMRMTLEALRDRGRE